MLSYCTAVTVYNITFVRSIVVSFYDYCRLLGIGNLIFLQYFRRNLRFETYESLFIVITACFTAVKENANETLFAKVGRSNAGGGAVRNVLRVCGLFPFEFGRIF